jgi:predicted anti-sigma-YlaC factor YlaD
MSRELPSGETGVPADPADLPRPVLWPRPAPGAQPVPMHGRDEGGEEEEIAKRRLPMAWAGIAILCVAVVTLGLAVGRQSWILTGVGLALGAVGGGLALKSRIMEAATVGQSVKDE